MSLNFLFAFLFFRVGKNITWNNTTNILRLIPSIWLGIKSISWYLCHFAYFPLLKMDYSKTLPPQSSTAFLTSFHQVNLLPVAVRRGIIRGEPLLHSPFQQQTFVFSTIFSSFFLSLRKYMPHSFKDSFLRVGYSDSIDLRPDIAPFFTLFFWWSF